MAGVGSTIQRQDEAMTRNDAIAANIAARITRNKNTRYKFSTLHRLALEETQNMSNTSCTTTGLAVNDSEANRTPIGRPLADNPATLAAASPARLTPDAGLPYTVGSQVSVGPIKPVDRKTITGSYPGDSRSSGDSAKAAMDHIANVGGPRTQMAGQQNSRNYNENGKAFKSTSNPPDSEAGN
jgi:hypothetical protein